MAVTNFGFHKNTEFIDALDESKLIPECPTTMEVVDFCNLIFFYFESSDV